MNKPRRHLPHLLLIAAALCTAATAHGEPCSLVNHAATVQQVSAARARGATCSEDRRFAPAAKVAWSLQLEGLARQQAGWLADYGMLVHTGRGGETISQRAGAAGYRFARIAENLAQGQPDVPAVLAAWSASTGHCVNLHDPQVTEMALACAPGPDGRAMWVLVLGRQL